MRIASRVYFGFVVVALAGLLAACGATSSTGPAADAATASATATATLSPTATATALATVEKASLPSTCLADYGGPSLLRVGDLVLSQVAFGLTYPSYQLPDGIPLAPFKLPTTHGNPNPGSPPANPGMREPDGGYVLSVCNVSSSQSHILESFAVRVAAFTAYNGQLNAWQPCNQSYSAQYKMPGSAGCGGGAALNEALHATFPADAEVGATVVAVQTGSWNLSNPSKPFPPLPLALAPGQSVSIDIGLTVPTTPGTYTFTFGVSVDGAPSPVFFSTPPAALFAPVAHEWDGQACMTAAMQSQIPASSTDDYVCPKS